MFLSNCLSTPGATFVSKQININHTDIEFEIWDTAGQEKYRSLTRMFYKDSHAALLVYDITQKKTFIELKEFWLKEIHSNGPKAVIIFIIGNKNDLFEKEEVPEEEARKLADEEKAFFAVVSAKNCFGINELFRVVGEKHLSEYWKNNADALNEIERRKEIRTNSVKIQPENKQLSKTTVNATSKKCC